MVVTGRFTCCGCWCVCVLPVRTLLRSSAQVTVAVFASLILVVAIVPLVLALLIALSDARRGALTPSAIPQLLYVASCTMIATGVTGCCAACSPPWRSFARRSLALMISITLVFLTLMLLSASVAFMRTGIIHSTRLEQLADATYALQSSFLDHLR